MSIPRDPLNALTSSKYGVLDNRANCKPPTLTLYSSRRSGPPDGCKVKLNILKPVLMRKGYFIATTSCAVFLDTQYLLLVISYHEKASSLQIFYLLLPNHKFFQGFFKTSETKGSADRFRSTGSTCHLGREGGHDESYCCCQSERRVRKNNHFN